MFRKGSPQEFGQISVLFWKEGEAPGIRLVGLTGLMNLHEIFTKSPYFPRLYRRWKVDWGLGTPR